MCIHHPGTLGESVRQNVAWPNVAWTGRPRSGSVSRAWRTGPPPIRSPRATAGATGWPGRQRADRAACPGQAGQREPAPNEPAASTTQQMAGFVQGWADPSSTHARCRYSPQTPDPDVDAPRLARRRVGTFISHHIARSLDDDRLPAMHQPVDQGRCQGVVHAEQVAPFPEGSIREEHDRSGCITGSDYLEQQIGPLVDRQIAQLIEKENGTSVASVTRESGGFMIAQLIEKEKLGTSMIESFPSRLLISVAASWLIMSSRRAELARCPGIA